MEPQMKTGDSAVTFSFRLDETTKARRRHSMAILVHSAHHLGAVRRMPRHVQAS